MRKRLDETRSSQTRHTVITGVLEPNPNSLALPRPAQSAPQGWGLGTCFSAISPGDVIGWSCSGFSHHMKQGKGPYERPALQGLAEISMRLANSKAGGHMEQSKKGGSLDKGGRAVTNGWKRTVLRGPAGKPSHRLLRGTCSSYRTVSPQPLTQAGCTGLSLRGRHTTLLGSEGGRGSILIHESPEWGFMAIVHCAG